MDEIRTDKQQSNRQSFIDLFPSGEQSAFTEKEKKNIDRILGSVSLWKIVILSFVHFFVFALAAGLSFMGLFWIPDHFPAVKVELLTRSCYALIILGISIQNLLYLFGKRAKLKAFLLSRGTRRPEKDLLEFSELSNMSKWGIPLSIILMMVSFALSFYCVSQNVNGLQLSMEFWTMPKLFYSVSTLLFMTGGFMFFLFTIYFRISSFYRVVLKKVDLMVHSVDERI